MKSAGEVQNDLLAASTASYETIRALEVKLEAVLALVDEAASDFGGNVIVKDGRYLTDAVKAL